MKHPLCVIVIIHWVNYLSPSHSCPLSALLTKAKIVCIPLLTYVQYILHAHRWHTLKQYVSDNTVVALCLMSLRAHAAYVSVCVLAAVLMQWTAEMGWTQKLEASLFSATVESGNEKGPDGGEMNVSVALRINTVILAYVTKSLLHKPFIFTTNILHSWTKVI